MKKIINYRTISTLLAIVLACGMAYVMTFCFNDASTIMLAEFGRILIETSEKAIRNHTTPAGMLLTIVSVAVVYAATKFLFAMILKNIGKKKEEIHEEEA